MKKIVSWNNLEENENFSHCLERRVCVYLLVSLHFSLLFWDEGEPWGEKNNKA